MAGVPKLIIHSIDDKDRRTQPGAAGAELVQTGPATDHNLRDSEDDVTIGSHGMDTSVVAGSVACIRVC